MVRSHDSSNFPIEIIFAQTVNNIAGAAYGLQIANEPYFMSSLIGIAFQFIWLSMWYWVVWREGGGKHLESPNPSPAVVLGQVSRGFWRRRINPFLFSVLLATLLSTCIFALTLVDINVNGTICVLLTFLLGVSPLARLGVMIRQRDSASIPVPLTMTMLITNIAWAMYGVQLDDNYIILPSIFGFIICVFQLIVSAWCNEYLFYDLTFLQWLFGAAPTAYLAVSRTVSTELRRVASLEEL